MKNKIVVLAALAGITVPVHAATLTLTEIVERAWSSAPSLSPQVQAQNQLYQLSSGDRWRRFLPNEPQFQYENQDDATAEVLSITEAIAFPGKAIASTALDKAKQRFQWAELQAKRYDAARTLAEAYLDQAVATALVEQQKRNIQDLESLATSLKARYESGIATQAETIVTELQLRQQRADLATLQDKAEVSARRLKKLLNLGEDEALQLELPDDLDERVISELGSATADEARAEAAIELASANHSLSTWNQLPDVNLGYSRNHYLLLGGSPNGKAHTRSYMVGMSVPIFFPFAGHIEAKRQRAQSDIDRAVAELQMLGANEERELAAREYARSKARLKELREKDLPFAEALMESTFSSYKAGRLGFAELVLARKTLMDLRAQDVQLRGAIISAHLRSLTRTGGV